jgi:O-antigen/teichoic acid export membrane protein
MRKHEKIRILKNVGSSWISLAVNIATGLILSPFILHRLGETAFGIWVLIFSLTGYYGLFDLGVRSSIVRFVSKYKATEERGELAKIVNTSVFVYSVIGVVCLLVTAICTYYVDRMFPKIPLEYHTTARILLAMVGTSVALGFPLGIFGGFLEGIQRFDIMNWTNIASTLLRTVLIIIYLNRGYGLLTVAIITVALPLITAVVRGAWALRLVPVPLGPRYVTRATFREMAHYSGATFINILAGQFKFKSDEIIIGAMMTPASVAYFSIGNRITDYARQLVVSLAQIFVPMASESDAQGKMDRLRKIFVAGNRVCAFISFPICAALIILGKSVIEVWMGKKYIVTSYPVLVIMIVPLTLMLSQAASGRILFGISKHWTWAFVSLAEGVANVILSILLIPPYGIIGDAIGTAIPLSCSMIFFMPAHVSRHLGIRVWTFVRQAYTLPLLLTAPLAVTLLALQRWYVPHTYLGLAGHALIGGAVYGAGLFWVYKTNRAFKVENLVVNSGQDEKSLASPAAETWQEAQVSQTGVPQDSA